MTAFIIIFLASVVLYGSGLMRWWLNKCRLYEPQPEPLTASEDPEEPKREPTPERLKLEAVAMNILLYNGYKKPEPVTDRVKRLSDSELQAIIERFKAEL